MLIVLLDEPGLFVFPTPAAAVIGIEAPDAESQIRAAFDERGVPYKVDWLRPNRHRKTFFGLFSSVALGEYRFVPAGPPDRAALVRLLEEHPNFTTPPLAQADLSSLLSTLRAASST
ncbi:MAG: hypothetical protein ACXWM3_09830 [Gemmatimonadaceae bacterium]